MGDEAPFPFGRPRHAAFLRSLPPSRTLDLPLLSSLHNQLDEAQDDDDDDDEEEEDQDLDDDDDDDDDAEDDNGENDDPLDDLPDANCRSFGLKPYDPLKIDRSSHSYASWGLQKGPGSLNGASAALSLSRNDGHRALLKAVEQEKQQTDDWSEGATLALLQAWGEKYVELGRKNLGPQEWTAVAEKVTRSSKTFKTDIQSRNRIDKLKRVYKREKHKQATIGGSCSKWPYYKQMDAVLNPTPRLTGLPCAVDAGQILRMDPRIWKTSKREPDAPTNANSTSFEQRDSSEMSESSPNIPGNEHDFCQTSKKRKSTQAPFRIIAKAIKRFGEIYEKMESAKQQQLLELEKTRMEFTRDLELRKMQLLMQTQMELAKMKQGANDIDASVGNMSG